MADLFIAFSALCRRLKSTVQNHLNLGVMCNGNRRSTYSHNDIFFPIILPIIILTESAVSKTTQVVRRDKTTESPPIYTVIALLVIVSACIGIGLSFRTAKSGNHSAGAGSTAPKSLIGEKPSQQPVGTDVAVRSSLNSDGSVKRKAHIRSYPDGIKSNNYSENPGLREKTYGE